LLFVATLFYQGNIMTKKVEIICHSKHLMYETEIATVTFLGFPYRCIQELATHRTNHPSAIANTSDSFDTTSDDQLVSINPFTENISRNSESSRAVPTPMLIERIMSDPYIPQWRKAQKGMQGGDQLSPSDRKELRDSWLKHRDNCVALAEAYYQMGVCKQDISALLLPFMRVDIIATGSGKAWQNFIKLRAHQDAHPDFANYAYELADLLQSSKPEILEPGEWHVPYGKEVLGTLGTTQSILAYSTIKCARFSYKGALSNVKLDLPEIHAKARKMFVDGHMSPFEHQVKCVLHQPYYDYKTLQKGWRNQRTLTEYPV
jgi:hypothetical protein